MIWALSLIAPLIAFVALMKFGVKPKRRALPPVQEAVDPHDDRYPVATPEVPEAVTKNAPVIYDPNSVFDKLRGAMDGGDTSLFAPLQIALDELVRVCRSLEVHMPRLTQRLLRLTHMHRVATLLSTSSPYLRSSLIALRLLRALQPRQFTPPLRTWRFGSYFTLLESRSLQFHTDLSTYHTLRMVLRVWNVLSNWVNIGSTGPPATTVQDADEVKNLLTGLASMLEIFEVIYLIV